MAARGGAQRIPRPLGARPGGPAPWAGLTPGQRRVTLDDVRAACASLPPPRRPAGPATARPAAVLMPIFEETSPDGGAALARVILTKRPDTMPSHQGEIAFPGGKLEASVDADLRDAALREAKEEIGLDPSLVEIVAELDSMTTVAGRFVLTPFVGLIPGRPDLTRDPREVVSVFDVAISELLDPDVYREERWDIPAGVDLTEGQDRAIHFFELADETVWGATARIFVAFLKHLVSDPRPSRR